MEDKDFEIAMELHTKKCENYQERNPKDYPCIQFLRQGRFPKNRLIQEYKPTYPKDVTCFLNK